jgi:ankyrin repeat protein
MTHLVTYAETGDITGIEQAHDAGADIDARDERGRTAAMAATYANQVEAVALLFERGANPDIQDNMLNNPFLYAGAEGYLDIVRLANAAEADPAITNRFGGTALIPASEHGYVETVRYLLEETEVDVNHINNLGWTALLEAIILSDGGPNQQAVVKLLLDYDADVTIADHDGVTPLAHARRRGFREIEHLLLDAGATGRSTRRQTRK